MNRIARAAVGLAVSAALVMPAGASAAPPSHAKAWGKRCQGQSKVKDPVTKMSPFKACVKAKGVGFTLGEDGNYTPTPPPPPAPPADGGDGGDTGGDTGGETTT